MFIMYSILSILEKQWRRYH